MLSVFFVIDMELPYVDVVTSSQSVADQVQHALGGTARVRHSLDFESRAFAGAAVVLVDEEVDPACLRMRGEECLVLAAHDTDIAPYLESGMCDVIRTPINPAEMAARVKVHLRSDDLLVGATTPPCRRWSGPSAVELHDSVTVVFVDVCEFTHMCSENDPRIMLDRIGGLFTSFDRLAREHQIEKLGTAGDCYIGGCGHTPSTVADHASRTIGFAMALVSWVENNSTLRVRVGVNTGRVVCGLLITGSGEFSMFGDTMNVASRMQSTGEPMCIHASGATVEAAVREGMWESMFLPLGSRHIKGKGEMRTFFVNFGKAQEPGVYARCGRSNTT